VRGADQVSLYGKHDAVGDLRCGYQLDENHLIACGLVAAAGTTGATVTSLHTALYALRASNAMGLGGMPPATGEVVNLSKASATAD
jgi:hypothetical protein